MPDEKKPFWETLPGILTGIAAVLTALGSLVGLFVHKNNQASQAIESSAANEVRGVKKNESASESRRESRPIDVSGAWNDMLFGTRVRMEQSGEQIYTKTYNGATGVQLAEGQGVIAGRRLTGTNRWFNGAAYSIDMKISRDGKTITGTFRNSLNGETGDVHLVR